MNILFDHQIFCLQQYGGISRYFYELAIHLAETLEQNVEIFAPFYLNKYLSADSSVANKGIKISKSSRVARASIWVFDTALAYSVLKSRRGVDIFHETYYSGIDCCPSSAKRIITIHDMLYEKFSDLFPEKDRMRQIRKHAIENADHIICVSENTRKDVLELLHVPEEKTSVVYHGHSFDKRNETSLVSIRKPYLLYVGQRGGYKNFDLLLRAYAHSPKLGKIFSLICFGGGAFRPAEQMRIKELGLLSQDVMQVSGDDTFLEGLYRGAEAFIYPSLYEGFGIPLLEAMALSCPVVCSNASCFSEVVGGAAEFFDAGDEESIRTSIEKVVFSNEYKTACVQRGRERAKLFSWDRCAKETMQIYTNQIEI